MGNLNIPIDDWLVIDQDLDIPSNIQKINLSTVPGSIYVAPSSYIYKYEGLFKYKTKFIHPAWYYSNLDIDKQFIDLPSEFRDTRFAVGDYAVVKLENIKNKLISDTLDVAVNTNTRFDIDFPIEYVGTHKNYNTTEIYDNIFKNSVPSNLIIRSINAVEFELELTSSPTEDLYFHTPVSSPKLDKNTIYGKTGIDSTIPANSWAGLIKVSSNLKLSMADGKYTVDGLKKSLITSRNVEFYKKNLTSNRVNPNYTKPHYDAIKDWYNDSYIKTTEKYITLKEMVDTKEVIALVGYVVSHSTIGNGIFVDSSNKTKVLPWNFCNRGITYSNVFKQTSTVSLDEVEIGKALDCKPFIDNLYNTLSSNTEYIDKNSWMPICNADIQVTNIKYDTCTEILNNTDLLYEQLDINGNKLVPLYIPDISGQYYYQNSTVFNYATSINYIKYSSLNDILNLKIILPEDILDVVNLGNIEYDISNLDTIIDQYMNPSYYAFKSYVGAPYIYPNKKGINIVSPNNPIGTQLKNLWRVVVKHYERIDAHYTMNNNATYIDSYDLINKSLGGLMSNTENLNIGTNSYIDDKYISHTDKSYIQTVPEISVVPTINQHTMMFIGMFKAGTPAGIYKFKPFNKYLNLPGILDREDTNFKSINLTGKPIIDSTKVPYLGLNITSLQLLKCMWTCAINTIYRSISDYNFSYKAYKILENFKILTDEFVSNQLAQSRLLVDTETSPLVGYAKKATQPAIVDIPEFGKNICYLDDLVLTAPFYSEYYKEWVIVGYTAQLHTLYVMSVELSEDKTVLYKITHLITSIPIYDCPYGYIRDSLGIQHIKEVDYTTKTEVDTLVLYVLIYNEDTNIASPTIIILRDDFIFNLTRDNIITIPYDIPIDKQVELNSTDIIWPKGVAVMYPYAYVLGYKYLNTKYKFKYDIDIADPLSEPQFYGNVIETDITNINKNAMFLNPPTSNLFNIPPMEGTGWQMCLNRVDIVAGSCIDSLPIKSFEMFRNTYGICANINDYKNLWTADKDYSIFGYEACKYTYTEKEYIILTNYNKLEDNINKYLKDVYESERLITIITDTRDITYYNDHKKWVKTSDKDRYGDYIWKWIDKTVDEVITELTNKKTSALNSLNFNKKELATLLHRCIWAIPTSNELPSKVNKNLPTLTSISSVSAQLICTHMGKSCPCVINPVTGYIEAWGLEQYPFSYPFNLNIASAREFFYATYPFAHKMTYSSYPFMHICIGDGLPPVMFSSGIDIQDISYGSVLERVIYIKSNLTRDKITKIVLSVPHVTELAHSNFLKLKWKKEDEWADSITITEHLRPLEKIMLYLKVEPTEELHEPLNLYLNVVFNRVTCYYGFLEPNI